MISWPVTSTEDGRYSSVRVAVGARGLRPPQRGKRHQGRRIPRVQHVGVAAQRAAAGQGARIGLGVGHIYLTLLVVPGGNLVAPPQLARDAPVLDVFQPLAVHDAPLVRENSHRPAVDRLQRDLRQRLAGAVAIRAGPAHRHVPLVRQHRLDHLAGAAATGHRHPMRLLRHHQAGVAQVLQHRLARLVAVQPAVLGRGVLVDRCRRGQDRERSEAVTLPEREVVEIVRRRDLHRARSELRIDIGVRDDRNRAAGQRQDHFGADTRLVAGIVRVDRHRHVAQQRFRTGGGDHQPRAAVGARIADLPDPPVLLLAFDFQVRHRGLQLRIPVDQALAAIDQPLLVQANEGFDDHARAGLVHREIGALPVARIAQPLHLLEDRVARILLPLPHRSTNCSRDIWLRGWPCCSSWRSTTIWVAMPAWSVPGSHSVL